MRRLLFVAYYVPPREGVATARSEQIIGYLSQFGWEVTVVTPQLEGADRAFVQTGFIDTRAFVKKLLGLQDRGAHAALGAVPVTHGVRRSFKQWLVDTGYVVVAYPDGAVGWIPSGRSRIRELLSSGRFDAVLSSAPPFSTNVMLALARPCVPWVADFRDLWSDTDAHASGVRRACDIALEHWSMRRASALTTISEPMAQALRTRHPARRVDVIPNGFDEDEWARIPFESETACTLLYAGTFHAGRRDPALLFRAVRSLLDRGSLTQDQLVIDFYAPQEPWLRDAIASYRLEGLVRVKGSVSRTDVMRAERRSDRLLVVLWDGPGAEGTVTGKLFEYLGARRRVVAIGGPQRCAIDNILASTGAGERYRTQPELEREVLAAVDEHRRQSIRVIDDTAVEPFRATAMARRFADLFNDLLGSRATRTA